MVSWRGIFPALSTPTNRKGELDEESLRSEVEWNIKWGAHGLAVSIIAGEFYKFAENERMRIFEITVDEANGKVPVLAGISHSGTEPAVMMGKYAKDIGADGLIVMPPYFRKGISSVEIIQHFREIAGKIDLPIMIQDAEDAIGIHMCPTLYMSLLDEFSNIVAVKVEGRDTLQKISDIKRLLDDRLIIFGGMAARLIFQELALGASGNIPDACLTDLLVRVYENIRLGKRDAAREIYAKYKLWLDFLSSHSTSSAEIEKETLRLRGVIRCSHTRGPNVPLSPKEKAELKEILARIDLI